ncbi:MAG: 16S rRNA (cytosine(967)-C(5))-methyltransferase RsmB [Candidatus Sumerlaeota bacterium]|nr:16S rRNA (cytosine(967)-C(5))-methyltransferase RsmB [Candidatus Sumerlaeota bacterium]
MTEKGPSLSRIVAFHTLMDVEQNASQGSAERLDYWIRRMDASEKDARLASALVYGVLRNKLFLDFQYAPHLRAAPSRLSRASRVLLRMAAAQKFLFTRLPAHAVANESVELARRDAGMRERGTRFINAIVRRILSAAEPRLPDPADRDERMSVEYSIPRWLLGLMMNKFGAELTGNLLAAQNGEPPAALRANALRGAAAQLARELASLGIAARAGELAPQALVLEHTGMLGAALATPLFAAGRFYVQDEASQLVSHIACPREGERILDMCAAPGGKTTHLAELSGGRALITATDASPARLGLLRDNVERLGTPGIEVMTMEDALARARSGGLYDLVLADAPCSGLGTIRRHPEIRYRRSMESVKRCASEQLQLLRAAVSVLAPGGRIVYSTCTVSDEENAAVIKEFLGEHTALEIDLRPRTLAAINALRCGDGFFRTWPRFPRMDGFESVILRVAPRLTASLHQV